MKPLVDALTRWFTPKPAQPEPPVRVTPDGQLDVGAIMRGAKLRADWHPLQTTHSADQPATLEDVQAGLLRIVEAAGLDAMQAPGISGKRGGVQRPASGIRGPKKVQDEDVRTVPVDLLDRIRDIDRLQAEKFPGHLSQLVEDVRANGVRNPVGVLYDKQTGRIVMGEGNTRLAAAKKLGLKELEARFIPQSLSRDKSLEGRPLSQIPVLKDARGFTQHPTPEQIIEAISGRQPLDYTPTGPNDIRPTVPPEYVYHGTSRNRAFEIADSGKLGVFKPNYGTDQRAWPDGSTKKRAYFSGKEKTVESFFPDDGTPAVLRVKRGSSHKVESGTGDVYSESPIAAKDLEIRLDDGTWVPLTEWAKKP